MILTLNLRAEAVAGAHTNEGRAALRYGPFVLAYDQKLSPDAEAPADISLPRTTSAFSKSKPF